MFSGRRWRRTASTNSAPVSRLITAAVSVPRLSLPVLGSCAAGTGSTVSTSDAPIVTPPTVATITQLYLARSSTGETISGEAGPLALTAAPSTVAHVAV